MSLISYDFSQPIVTQDPSHKSDSSLGDMTNVPMHFNICIYKFRILQAHQDVPLLITCLKGT
uniref:Uncharacterized protein n=1 Tax=Rhizophora mucronata TaxID=61149 RepID=A0A2P2QL38_RHIMU